MGAFDDRLSSEIAMDPNLQGASAGTRATSLNRRRAQWFAKVVAMPAAALAITFMPAGQAKEASASRHDVQGKMSYCETCHGYQGRGFHAYNPIPRLAGQQPEYIKAQLQAFVERGRTNNIMYNVSHVMSPDLVSALATNFNQLNPKPIGGGQKDLVPAGKKIFEDGIPSANVPACAPVMGQMPRVTDRFRDWRGSSPTTCSTN